MVCSACGFENAANMRFCGMCGMPLPQRPLTAPGAHSTLNFTRVPLDSRATGERSTTQNTAGVLVEMPAKTTNGGGRGSAVESGASATTLPEPTPEPPAKELVPDVPLDEYVQSFKYEPPKDPAEITMRGDAHLATSEIPAQPPLIAETASQPLVRGENIVASSSAAEVKPPLATTSTAAAEDVDNRLGLEPETPTEARIARPRFLDINEPPKETKTETPKETKTGTPDEETANGGTTISGPSFLGLSDRPQTWAAAVGVEDGEYAPRNYHWRAWFAVAVVLVFVGLGFLEWRSQVNQTDNGPVEVIRTKLRKIHGAVAQMTGDSGTPSDNNSKPDMQVQEQPHAQPAQQPNPNDVTGAATTGSAQSQQPADQSANNAQRPNAQTTPAPSNATPTPAAESTPDTSAKAPGVSAKQPAADTSAQQTVAAAKPPAKRIPDKTSDADATTKAPPGAAEMMKAKNASDSAAEAAWLWKATAKGNSDAPVQLADMYIQGSGVPRSCEQAVVLLKTAAEKENARARNRLASMYASGTCVQRNRVEAYRWLSSALTANPDSQWAQQNRDLIWQQMTPDERAAAQKYR